MPGLWFRDVSTLFFCAIPAPILMFYSAKKFKQVISNMLLCRHSISSIEPLFPFPPLGSLLHKTIQMRDFDTIFITSYLFANNYTQEKVDLGFAGYGCLVAVKLNQAW